MTPEVDAWLLAQFEHRARYRNQDGVGNHVRPLFELILDTPGAAAALWPAPALHCDLDVLEQRAECERARGWRT